MGRAPGWVLPGTGREGSQLHLQLPVPPGAGYRYPYDLTCRFDDGGEVRLSAEHAGDADFYVPLPDIPANRVMELQLTAAQSRRPAQYNGASDDARELAVQLGEVEVEATPAPCHVQPGEGWYEQESDGHLQWQWMNGNAELSVRTSRAGALVVDAGLLSSTGENTLELLVDGRPAGAFPVSASEWSPLAARLPLEAGLHHVVLHSRNPGVKVGSDPRVLAMRVRDLQVRLE